MTTERLSEMVRSGEVRIRVGFPPVISLILAENVVAITFGRNIWIHPRVVERVPDFLNPILRHELAHVAQYKRDGMLRFLGRYLFEYFRGRFRGLGHQQSYASISYEIEARSCERSDRNSDSEG